MLNYKKVEDLYPLSPIQFGLLFQSLYAPDSDAYFVQSVFELEGDIDQQAFKNAWQAVSDHHHILRTGFVWQDGGDPEQYVLESAEVPFIIEDWRNLTQTEQDQKLEDVIQQDRKKGFDLSKAPLFRLSLIQCTGNKYCLIYSQHHILLDGWANAIVLADVFKAYKDIRQNKEVRLKTPRPYRDYIAWLQQQDLNKAEVFWKNYLFSLEGPTLLSFKSIIAEDKTNNKKDYDHYSTNFSIEETEQLKSFAGENDLTLNTIIQGAVGTVLKTYTNQQEVVMGVTVSGRNIDLSGIEEMVGIFINTLPLRIIYKPEESIISFLKNLQTQAQKLNDYAYTPLAQIQSWAKTEKSLFDVIFVFENYPIDESTNNDSSDFIITAAIGIEKTEYPLTVKVCPGKQLSLSLSYQTQHFNEELIKRLADHIKQILQKIISEYDRDNERGNAVLLAHSHKPIQAISLLTSQEEHQLLIEWNDTKAEYPEDKTIHQLFEEQVKRTPDNIAIIYEEQKLTYRKLNEKANQLAHYLRSLGVKPDTLVAIAVERSLEMIVGLLGILKAGGAYVPLDPTYPEERLKYILEDTKAPILLIQSSLKFMFSNYSGIIIPLDHHNKWDIISHEQDSDLSSITLVSTSSSTLDPAHMSLPHNLAYVIYTSGSTGKPKGVMVEHKGLSNRLTWMQATYKLTLTDRVIQKTPFTFDVSVWELFWPLLVGATEVIAESQDHKDPNLLLHLIDEKKISVCHFVPSILESFLNKINLPNNLSLRLIITSGEVLPYELAKKCFLKSKPSLHNLYGPTEASIDVTHYSCYDQNYRGIVPIGRPISNTQIYILDSQMNPVPVGVAGEIYIGGAGPARGYLGRPDLTAERFVPNPFAIDYHDNNNTTNSLPHSLRLYRTGDLARYLSDGNIEFLGRIDDQIKIRGFRIELGEIESTLNVHESVSQAVVIAREDILEDKKIVAYVVVHKEALSSTLSPQVTLTSSSGDSFAVLNGEAIQALTEDLRNHLIRSLPDYMIPSFFVYLDQIPLTPNGKTDRKSLPAPDLSLRQVTDEYVPASTELERELSSIWSEVLRIDADKIGVHDNFFKLGGDSIISIQIVSRARSRGIHFSVKDIFNYPTIASLSSVTKTEENILGLKADQGILKGEVPLTPIQRWFFDSNHIEYNHFNQATLLLASEILDLSVLNKTFSLLVSHHDALRLRLRHYRDNHNNLSWKQEFRYSVDDHSHVCALVDLSASTDDELAFDIEKECSSVQRSLDIENGPVIKAVLFDCGLLRPQRLLIVIHHLMVDGVSWRILTEDLARFYTQLAKGETTISLSKTHSYQQWANALYEYATSAALEKEIPYWQKIESTIAPLPIDFNLDVSKDSAAKTDTPTWTTIDTISISMTEEETINLLQKVPKAYRTQINDILLTALVLAIGDWTKKYKLTLSLEGHGREEVIKDIDLSRTVGWFTSIFPVYLEIENPNDLAESIKTVKESLREIPNKGIGYGVLSYLREDQPLSISSTTSLLSDESSTPTNAVHQSLSFNYLGQWDNTTSEGGLFTFAQESSGNSVSAKNNMSHLLDINCEVKGGTLDIFFTYSCSHYNTQTIERLSNNFSSRLRELIKHCCLDNSFGYTSSDFKLVTIDQAILVNKILQGKNNE